MVVNWFIMSVQTGQAGKRLALVSDPRLSLSHARAHALRPLKKNVGSLTGFLWTTTLHRAVRLF